MPRLIMPYGLQRNPDTWRFRLARMLLGDTLEAVAHTPHRPLSPYDRLIIRLGDGGATNTVEVYHPDMSERPGVISPQLRAHARSMLLPIDDVNDMYPETFVVVEFRYPDLGKDSPDNKVVGTFHGWTTQNRKRCAVLETRDMGTFSVPVADIVAAYYAPSGFQMQWLEGRPLG